MIIETEKLDYKSLVLPETLKFDKNIFNKILDNIKQNQKQPYGKLYIFIHLMLFPDMVNFLKKHEIDVKSIIMDKNMLRLEF